MQKSSSTEQAPKQSTSHFSFRKVWPLLTMLWALALVTIAFLPMSAHAETATPPQPASLTGTSGNQQASLSWSASTGATGYLVNETDLVTGQTTQLSTVVTTTSTTVTGLQVGHWYSFTITPFDGTGQGPASSAVEIRTTGFAGSYQNYYALGDSYSSGEGAGNYTGVQACYRSTSGYPYRLGVSNPTIIACSGAVTADIDQVVQNSSLPGTQLSQIPNHPQGNTLITLTIGGNDIGFASELTDCIVSFTSCTHDQSTISAEITALQPRLTQIYKELKAVAPGADIIAVGYPLLVADPSIADCHNPVVYIGLSGAEMTMIRTLAAQLDNTIAAAATQAGVTNATQTVEQAFAGHEACTANESVEDINEVTSTGVGSFHPDATGYQLYANAIKSTLSSLYTNGAVRS